jgi:thymidylate synthase
MEFDLRGKIPFITTKKLFYESVIKELLFFISGATDTKLLEQQKVTIWKKNTSKESLQELGLKYDEGDMGPGYSFQWRHFGAEYKGCDVDYSGQGVDQLQMLINGIRNDPFSRRHILSAWNPAQISEMALPPCHVLAQFYVSADKQYLDCQLYQRSGDLFLGVPFNIASYALLTYMIAHITNLKPRKLVHVIGDAHIYNNHGDQVKRQISRTPKPFPRLTFREASKLHEIDDFTYNSFIIEGYTSHQAIQADMAR